MANGEDPTLPPLEQQVGGNHYKHFKIQPLEFNIANDIPWAEGEIIKYVSRHKFKNGIEDLKKARHILDCLIETLEKEIITNLDEVTPDGEEDRTAG